MFLIKELGSLHSIRNEGENKTHLTFRTRQGKFPEITIEGEMKITSIQIEEVIYIDRGNGEELLSKVLSERIDADKITQLQQKGKATINLSEPVRAK